MLLYLADREGRLIGQSADAFAVIEPPIARKDDWNRAMRAQPGRVRALSLLVRVWPLLLPYGPAFAAMVVAVPIALVSREAALVALVLVLLSLCVAIADLTVGAVRLSWEVVQAGSRGVPDGEIFGNELRGHHWTITFCQASAPDDADRLCSDALVRASELTDAFLPPDPAFGSGYVGVRAPGFTDAGIRKQLGSLPSLSRVRGTDWFVIGTRKEFRPPDHDAVRPLSVIRLMVLTALTGVAATAQMVAGLEQMRYPQALLWVARYVAFKFPESATWQSQVFGVLIMIMVSVMAGALLVTLRQRIRYRQARRDLLYGAVESRPTVAIIVVNENESRAVEEAVLARSPGFVPSAWRAGSKAVTWLGRIGGANVVLARSEQGTVGAGSMPETAGELIRHLDPACLILTGIGYGLDSCELDGGDQDLGDVVVATQVHAMDHRKVTTPADGTRHEITRGPRPEPTSSLLSHARALAPGRSPVVRFGVALSLNTLVNSPDERARLKGLDEEAILGEMEAAGLAAVAIRAKRDWILIKGISDWGVGKTGEHQARAARNAAEFTLDLIARIEPGGP
ncbi:hypothetical protein KOI35_21265 [Actinoplanes bogorensis]|uniref:Nucleoside phosphorylase domain-containing protein n=1 Tax=Paractinoplanes bogorensis TaxID=1610840 RepID=A0ABS5YRG8_9ACTN|nr:hypothetical protein [Actinoplanes bogorensis]MBU2666047.1 hypothetical protein [Actinoplanes bogorensis]